MDDYMREMGELKTLVTKTLEKKGVLARIRVTLFFFFLLAFPQLFTSMIHSLLSICPFVYLYLFMSLSLSLVASSIAKDCCGTMEVLLLFSLPLDVSSCENVLIFSLDGCQ
jgi:hypothetical protein